MPTATNIAGISDTNNEDARSTSSTLVNGEHSNRNENESNRDADDGQPISTSNVRHGFDISIEDEEAISFLHFSEKRHDTNAKPNPSIRKVSLEWVRVLCLS